MTGNPASYSRRPAIKSQPEEQLLFPRLYQQKPTKYLKLPNCDRLLYMLSRSLLTKHRTIQRYKA
jgi:hypothetical protein